MTYDSLYDEFILCVADDATRIQEIAKNVSAEPSDGMHVMFGMVVVPYVIALLEEHNNKKLKSVFEFFEKMAETEDSMISEVLEFTILEDLISRNKSILSKYKSFMGKKTLEHCSIIEKYMM